ncbi:hypothetical protein [Kitasatospora sp. NPDC090091]|uniref:hypothetical protein n=1 Tax=Kitasatospora sp. NPDC090091 TaxID=3364081 RepID=UPI00380DEC29
MSTLPSQPKRPTDRTPGATATPMQALVLTHQRHAAHTEGRFDAFDEPRWLIAARIADMRDCALAHHDDDAGRWADEYAAGALATWADVDAIDRLLHAIEEHL